MRRILSLLPASTEILCALGAGSNIVGITHECDYPINQLQHLPIVTSPRIDPFADAQSIDTAVRKLLSSNQPLYQLDDRLIERLNPDLVTLQGLCPVCAIDRSQVNQACKRLETSPEILEMTPKCLDDVLRDIQRLGDAADHPIAARKYVGDLKDRIMQIALTGAMQQKTPRVLILEWLNPFFSAGHWNPQLIELAGGEPVLSSAGQLSRQITAEEILDADPDVIVISCCGFTIERINRELSACRDFPWKKLRAVKNMQVFSIDGRYFFNRPGPRLIDSAQLLSSILFGNQQPDQSALAALN